MNQKRWSWMSESYTNPALVWSMILLAASESMRTSPSLSITAPPITTMWLTTLGAICDHRGSRSTAAMSV
eukprot:CAMPEP_0174743466 /NCGR_PEP_ID=MMETSP1094-20130205/81717_1 /TAXON_ID=156173 /ORGANISM="Chrysochromulina brevifilum, Strain UTEX LB 985" /LENGTH=69 /DNA_ID=CAMNT_0015947691 /DNA_START=15 /DNA_END=220 /DNA_ORIENTATION=-